MPIERIVSPIPTAEERIGDPLRPRSLQEFVGQEELTANLRVYLQAAKKRNEPLDHVLLYGPPGLGKTTLAYLLAREMDTSVLVVSGPSMSSSGDAAEVLSKVTERGILFIDEIHAVRHRAMEMLYSGMSEGRIDIMTGTRDRPEIRHVTLPKFTLVGATTMAGRLPSPLRDRFGLSLRLNYYTPDELAVIAKHSASILGIEVDQEARFTIGKRARGTPRIANRILRRLRDFAQVGNIKTVNTEFANRTLDRLGVDRAGLDAMDRRVLKLVADNFGGGPVGLEAIAAALSEDVRTIEEVYEPFLSQVGFLSRTPRGRIITDAGREHLALATSPATPSASPTSKAGESTTQSPTATTTPAHHEPDESAVSAAEIDQQVLMKIHDSARTSDAVARIVSDKLGVSVDAVQTRIAVLPRARRIEEKAGRLFFLK
jgi:Holliday junction DNA helicase RuvB